MQNAGWSKAIEQSADPPRAARAYQRLKETSAAALLKKASPEEAGFWLTLWSGSSAATDWLVAHPDWLRELRLEIIAEPRAPGFFERAAAKFNSLLEFKQRELLRITARDLARLSSVLDISREISNLADACIKAALKQTFDAISERLGLPYHQENDGPWQPTAFSILALGKLGGQELNYNSALDLLFVYSGEGSTFRSPPVADHFAGRGLANHEFFQQLCETFLADFTALFSVSAANPLARSLASYEYHYTQFGGTWDRLSLIKARPVAGDAELAADFIETIQPFRYARANIERAPREVAAIKARADREAAEAGQLERDLALGPGGIREIELIAQTLQLLHGGRAPFVQTAHTLTALQNLARYRFLKPLDAAALSEAYTFLRAAEHRLQIDAFQPAHVIPTERRARERLARLVGFATLADFERTLKVHTTAVRTLFSLIVDSPEATSTPLPTNFDDAEAWLPILRDHSFSDPPASLDQVRQFALGHPSPRGPEPALHLLDHFLARSAELSDPDRTLARLNEFVHAYGAGALLYETWRGNEWFFDLLTLLFDRSEALGQLAIATPDLVDEIEQSGQLRRHKSIDTILAELSRCSADEISRYHQAERMRIGLRDILKFADAEETQIELTNLADACIHSASPPNGVVIGLGALGAQELLYGSELQLLFIGQTNKETLAALKQAGFALTSHAFPTLAACEEHYEQRATLAEIQALIRARFIAGDPEIGVAFTALADRLTNFSQPIPIAAYQENWRDELHRLRLRLEHEHTSPSAQPYAIRTGSGGLADAEFAAQILCLQNGWRHPNTLRALARADAKTLKDSYRKLISVERVLQRDRFQPIHTLPSNPTELHRIAVRCGHTNADSFMAALASTRTALRDAYLGLA